MKHLFAFLLLSSLLSSCSYEAVRARQWKRYLKDVKNDPAVAPDTATGGYAASTEIDILDNLLRKYPGRQTVRTVTKTEYKTLPGKTIYVEVPAPPDTLRNRTERDSLLSRLQLLVQGERADSELRAEVARLRKNLLLAFNNRSCLPDTTISFPKYGITLKVQRGENGKYGFTIVEAPQDISYDTQVTEQHNGRVVTVDKVIWKSQPLWRDKWFWLMVLFASLSLWLAYLRIRDAKPATR